MLWARVLADLTVVFHAAYVSFVVFGLAAILLGVVFRRTGIFDRFWEGEALSEPALAKSSDGALPSLRRPFQGRPDSAGGCWGGCSLIWQPTARSSEARALPSSASTCTTWSSTCSTSRTVERTVA
jgi:hypothetical protein